MARQDGVGGNIMDKESGLKSHRLRRPISGLLKDNELGLFGDYYLLTMGKADLDHANTGTVTQNYFFRKIPFPGGRYAVTAGLEQAAFQMLNIGFTERQIQWLKATAGPDFTGAGGEEFLDHLRNIKFTGDVWAIPEGTPVFPREPIINVTGNTIDVKFFETHLLCDMNYQSLVATKAARICTAARYDGVYRACLDFGARRGHGRDAGMLSGRASFIAGFDGTSLLASAWKFRGKSKDLPYSGTMSHAFVQDRGRDELRAFREYGESFPHNVIPILDTSGDPLQGARNACIVGKELKEKGYGLRGGRLDSGNPVRQSKEVRKIFDREGSASANIYASNDLDEFSIEDMLRKGAVIDGFGVGTRLTTGANYNSLTGEGGVSAFDGVYKHVERVYRGRTMATIKVSADKGKTTLPGRKQVWRHVEDNEYIKDIIGLWGERLEKENPDLQPLLVPIILEGKQVYSFPYLPEIRRYCAEEMARLPAEYKLLSGAKRYKVDLSPKLQDLMDSLLSRK